jgi:hypothetical protein
MYHCDACGWDGAEPERISVPMHAGEAEIWQTLRVCPTCGEEVYETVVIRDPIIDPERGDPRIHEGGEPS